MQHEDRLAALDRREADLKAQQQSITTTIEAHRNKEGNPAAQSILTPEPAANACPVAIICGA